MVVHQQKNDNSLAWSVTQTFYAILFALLEKWTCLFQSEKVVNRSQTATLQHWIKLCLRQTFEFVLVFSFVVFDLDLLDIKFRKDFNFVLDAKDSSSLHLIIWCRDKKTSKDQAETRL